MKLHQVDAIGLQSLQGFVNLPCGGLLGATVYLGHEENLLTVTVAQSLSHSDFAGAPIIVPAVVHEREPTVDGTADDRNALRFVSLFSDMIPAQADGRDLLSSPPQSALGHSLISLGHQSLRTCGPQNRGGSGGFHERASAHQDVVLVRLSLACVILWHARQHWVSVRSKDLQPPQSFGSGWAEHP